MGIDTVRKKIGNNLFLYGIASILLLAAAGLLQWTDVLSSNTHFYLSLLLALCLGIIHLPLMFRYLLAPVPENFWKGLGITFLLMLLGAAGAGVIYYFIKVDLLLVTFVFPFVIPYLCFYAYLFFAQIPLKVYKVWHYPVNEKMPDLDMVDLSQIEVIQFVLHRKLQASSLVNFTSKAPLDMSLGQLFFIFINDYNEKNPQTTIEFLNGQNLPSGWVFYRKNKWFNTRYYFDPELSFRKNDIRPNELVYADRVEG